MTRDKNLKQVTDARLAFPPVRWLRSLEGTADIDRCAVHVGVSSAMERGFEVQIEPGKVQVQAASSWHARFAERCLGKLRGSTAQCCALACWPELSHRGIQLDLGRVIERPDTVKRLIKTYADLGYNVLQLYLEDAFVFPSHPQLARPFAWTTEVARAVVDFGLANGLATIPAIQSLGHCQWVTSKPEFAELDELHHRGGQLAGVLCPSHPRTLPMLEAMIADVAPLATAGIIHIGMDESFHIGQCERCRQRRPEIGEGGIFLEHANRLIDAVRRVGKRAAMWGDMFYYHPDQVERLDRSVLVEDWYYYSFEPLPRVELFNFADVDSQALWKRHEIESWGCPASIYTAMLPTNDPRESLANARSWLRYLKRSVAADGMMVTQWEMSWTSVDLALPTEAAIAQVLWGADRDDEDLLSDACDRILGDRNLSPLLLELGERRMHGHGMRRWLFCESPAGWITYDDAKADADAARRCDELAQELESRAMVFATAARWLAYQHRKRSIVNMLAASQREDRVSLLKLSDEADALAARWKRHWDDNRFEGDQRSSMYSRLRQEAKWLRGDSAWLRSAVLVVTVQNSRPGLPRLHVYTSSRGSESGGEAYVDRGAFYILQFDSRAAQPRSDEVLRYAIPVESPADAARVRLTAEGPGAFTLIDVVQHHGARRWRYRSERPLPTSVGCADPKSLFYDHLARGDSSQVFAAPHETIQLAIDPASLGDGVSDEWGQR